MYMWHLDIQSVLLSLHWELVRKAEMGALGLTDGMRIFLSALSPSDLGARGSLKSRKRTLDYISGSPYPVEWGTLKCE